MTHRYLVQFTDKEEDDPNMTVWRTDCGFHDGQHENAVRYVTRIVTSAPYGTVGRVYHKQADRVTFRAERPR
jgi:hypothetical protein